MWTFLKDDLRLRLAWFQILPDDYLRKATKERF